MSKVIMPPLVIEICQQKVYILFGGSQFRRTGIRSSIRTLEEDGIEAVTILRYSSPANVQGAVCYFGACA